MDRLPQELVEMVIDHLHNNRSALRCCSLVAKNWIPPARFHLFYIVDLNHHTPLTRWFETFSLSPTPARYVRTLRISNPDLLLPHQDLRVFTELHTLIIMDPGRRPIKYRIFEDTCKSLSTSLRSVFIFTFTMPDALLNIVCTFPYLESLHIFTAGPRTGAYNHLDSDIVPAFSPVFSETLSLRSLDVFDNSSFIEKLVGLPNSIKFCKMALACAKLSELCARNIIRLISSCAATLEELELCFGTDNGSFSEGVSMSSVSLEQNEILRHLSLEVKVAASNGWVIPLLGTLKSPAILSIRFYIRGSIDPEFRAPDSWELGWADIDRFLARLRRERCPQMEVRVEFDELIGDKVLYRFQEMRRERALVLIPE